MKKTLSMWLSLIFILSMALSACQPAPVAEQPAAEAPAAEAPAATEPAAAPETAGDKVVIRWFVGLGAGSEPENIPGQEALVEEFNATHDNIELVVEFVDYEQAPDVLSTQIAGGNPPDIIFPEHLRVHHDLLPFWLPALSAVGSFSTRPLPGPPGRSPSSKARSGRGAPAARHATKSSTRHSR